VTEPAKPWASCVQRLASPRAFLAVAAALSVSFLMCHLLGWRQHVSFLSGTMPAESNQEVLMGLVYCATYFGFVLVVPILVVAAGLFALLLLLAKGKSSSIDDAD
jgi:hypothetical protein